MDGKEALFATLRDITGRKRAEEELQANEKRLRIAQSIGKMGSWELDIATRTLTGSEEAGKIYGVNAAGTHVMAHSATIESPLPQYREMIETKLKELVEDGSEYNIEFELKRFDTGEIVWVHSKAEVDYDAMDRPVKITGIVQDITERKETEKALIESEAHLRELNATKDKFFSIISHDLKGPFSALLNLSDILVDEYDELPEDEKKSFIESIQDISNNTYKLFENLLEWSRMQSGRMQYNPETFNVMAELHPVLKLLKETAAGKGVDFKCNITPADEIYADKYMLNTVVRNLIANSIKFTEKDGLVELKINRTDEQYEISVSDDGVGISKENIEKLFKIDKTVSTKGTANEEGTGLGLALCKEMVEQHGGKIWGESEEGKGTTFTFSIPVK